MSDSAQVMKEFLKTASKQSLTEMLGIVEIELQELYRVRDGQSDVIEKVSSLEVFANELKQEVVK